MRLLRGDLRKLRRPLTVWVFLASAVLAVALNWASQANSAVNQAPTVYGVATCSDAHIPAGPACSDFEKQQHQQAQRQQAQVRHDASVAAAGRSVLGSGRYAAGLTASLLGAVALLLLGAAHVGGEFSGRTVKALLVEDPRRSRVLGVKVLSLWLVGVLLLLVVWAALAIAAWPLSQRYKNSGAPVSGSAALQTSFAQAGRALLVLAVYAVLSVLAAVVTRNVLGTLGVSLGVVIASLAVANIAGLARWTLAYPVSGWMHFTPGATPSDYLWVVSLPKGVIQPSAGISGLVLLAAIAACSLVAVRLFARADLRS